MITVDNGVLQFSVVPTRGMSLGRLVLKEEDAVVGGWASPVREVVHPMFVDMEQLGGLGWLTGFNEFLVRCGPWNNSAKKNMICDFSFRQLVPTSTTGWPPASWIFRRTPRRA